MPTLRLIKNNNKGSILVAVMVISGLIAFLIPSLYLMQQQAALNQSKRGDFEKYYAMVMAFKAEVEDPNNCHNIFGGTKLPGASKGKLKGLTLNWKYLNSEDNVAKNWVVPGSNIKISDVEILRTAGNLSVHEMKVGGSFKKFNLVPFRVYIYPRNLAVNLGNSKTLAPNPPELIRPMNRPELTIKLLANVDSTGAIYNCFGFESTASICQAVGGVYNHLGPIDLKCQPDTSCFPGNPAITHDAAECTSQGSVIHYTATDIGENDSGKTFYMCSLCKGDL
ncbi:MAG: hypothetical protein IT287_05940 [Bdellovibrionaceae bacterium]|nr:hypothetical protein [Pseudobdellovibrionaceae bacterium]